MVSTSDLFFFFLIMVFQASSNLTLRCWSFTIFFFVCDYVLYKQSQRKQKKKDGCGFFIGEVPMRPF